MSSPQLKELQPGLRRMLYLGSAFVLVAGFQLFVLADQTDVYFAWTIQPPLTAAVLGAFYWGTLVAGFLSAREKTWARARGAVPVVIFFTSITLAATLLHLDKFHLNSANPLTLIATYAWLGLYILEPPALIIMLFVQLRAPGGDLPRTRPLPVWFRAIIGLQASVLLLIAILLFVAPQVMIPLWPWSLTPLTARVMSAWLFSFGIVGWQVVWENDWSRVRIAMIGYALLGILGFSALLRSAGDIIAGAPYLWVYLAWLASMLFIGVYGWLRARRAEVTDPH